MRNSLNFNHLETFFTLAKSLSFSKTSEILKVAQPAISRQIKSLEEHFEKQLFIRTKQTVKLTKTGEELYEQTQPLYQEITKRVEALIINDGQLRGNLTFGCFNEIGEKVFLKPLSIFKKEHPELKITIKFLKGFEVLEGIKSGKIDIGVISERITQENIRCYEILSEEILLVTNKDNIKNDFSKIKAPQFVSYRENDPLLSFYLKKAYPRKQLKNYNINFIVNSHKAMIDVLLHHDFYAVLPSLSIASELDSGRLVNMGPKKLNSSLYLVYPDLEFEDDRTKAFSSFIRKYLKENY